MPGWTFTNLDDLKSRLAAPIASPTLPRDALTAELPPNQAFDLGKATLSVGATASTTVSVFNDANDTDVDGVIGLADGGTPDGALPPHLKMGTGLWLKLRAEAGVKANAGMDLADVLGLQAGASAAVAVAHYHAVRGDVPAALALVDAVTSPAFAASLAHVQALPVGDAVMFRRGGSITASVSVSASDLFTGQVGTLGRLLGSRGPIVLSFTAGTTLDVDVTVSDEFLIVFSRHGADAWRAGLRKAHASRVAAAAEAGIEAKLKNPKAVEKIARDVLASAVGQPLGKVKAILAKGTLADLKPAERKIFDAVADRLGVGGVISTLADLRDRIADLEARVDGVIKDVVRTRVRLSFAYEYSRIAQHVNLLQVTLDGAALPQFHADLLAGHTLPVLAAVTQKRAGVGLESYLNQSTLTTSAAWGFSLGIGKWVNVSGRDFRTVKQVSRFDVHGAEQRSYLGLRGYTGTWVGETFEWKVDLRADMKAYASPVTINDYTFGLHLAWTATQARLSASELEQWLDLALLWKVATDQGVEDVRTALAPAVGGAATLSVHLTVPNAVVRAVLPQLASLTPESYAGAMAAAMPWMEGHPARQDARQRRALYTPLWERALSGLERRGDEWARMAETHLRERGFTELAAFERQFDRPDPFSFAGLVQINGDARQACLRFANGATILHTGTLANRQDRDVIAAAFGNMDDLWTQSHHVRAVGVRVLDLAIQTGTLADVTRTLTVKAAALTQEVVVTA